MLPAERDFFVTWRLHGSLPELIHETGTRVLPGWKFRQLDRRLDKPSHGPRWLEQPEIAACVLGALLRGHGELRHYRLHAFVIMTNHVHVLISPLQPLPRIMAALKSTTARHANRLLQRSGARFWQEESFDHYIRTRNEFARVQRYIENNPVAAGLAKHPEHWRWSSANPTLKPFLICGNVRA